jgi:isoaspartyl peptidase/L-asparaginase-like protein (Ntn-hydrolase superfamily)
MQVIVHGGAGSAPDEPEPRQAVLEDAADVGAAESTPLDAVEAAVRVLESAPRFNAGVGGAVQSDGTIRTDAGIMTSDREAGAACSMAGVEHAVTVARAVMEETPHVLVAGERAVDLAEAFGVETDVVLWSDRTREKWADLDDRPGDDDPRIHLNWLDEKFGGSDTVGAVAREGEAFAAATSTGGRWLALAGRVGDVPQIGSGFYCGSAGGASATGAGEDIARVTLCRQAVRHLEVGRDAQAAADLAIEEFGELTDSSAGVIVLDRAGNAGEAKNSEAMQTAVESR